MTKIIYVKYSVMCIAKCTDKDLAMRNSNILENLPLKTNKQKMYICN